MDTPPMQAALAAGVVIVLVIITVVFSYTMGQEKSYEEALAERRQLLSNSILNYHSRKTKDKKSKKANKKSNQAKQKQSEEEDDTEPPSSLPSSTNQRLHVEFTEPTVMEEDSTESPQERPSTSKKEDTTPKPEPAKDKLHKPKQAVVSVEPEAKDKNQQNKIRPVDVKETKNKQPDTNSKDKEVKEKQEKQEPLKEKKEKLQTESVVKEKKPLVNSNSPDIQKQKKITKQPIQAQQPVSDNEKEEPVVEVVTAPLQTHENVRSTSKEKKKKKGELSGPREENPILSQIKTLVRNPEFSHVDLQTLINFLLNMQQDNPKEPPEWSEGKKDLVEKLKKQLTEKDNIIIQKQEDLQNAHAKLRSVRNELTAEKSELQQKFRALEEAFQGKQQELHVANNTLHAHMDTINRLNAKNNEDLLVLKKAHEENAAFKLKLQQVDLYITQIREAEATIQELKNRNNQLTVELHALNEQTMSTKDHQQGLIVQINRITKEFDDKDNYARQLEEIQCDLEQRLNLAHRQENEFKVKISELQGIYQQHVEDIRLQEQAKNQALEEVKNLQKQNDNLENTLMQLRNELRDAQANLTANANGVAQENELYKEQLCHLENELTSVSSTLEHAHKNVHAFESSIRQLEAELNEQKNKNNELRKKNWKVMDALKAAESKTLEIPKKSAANLDEIASKVRLEEQDATKKFFQRLFPDIDTPDNLSYDQWTVHVEEAIQRFVANLGETKGQGNQTEITKLQAKIKMYKEIISKTEIILKDFEKRIANEEVCWRTEVKNKEDEIEELKKQFSSELKARVQQLELELHREQEEKEEITKAYTLLKNKSSVSNSAITEQLLTEEINSSKESLKQLHRETNDVCSKEHNGNSTNGTSLQVG
ncbi:hypothetical protein ILUMI_26694 [Ignelater luminosus]|uniref:Kinectin n=1 Tax=Ignelater luminosus TaxID=2038154 RepID=A0A8K0C3J7_IGNLU|nr:hypothetical protein ILUMI_26694 [Ignelater luminosus]